MTKPLYILFDLDGTLVDSAPDLTAALNHTLGTLDLPYVDQDSVRQMVGFGARRLIEQGIEAAGVSLNDDEIEAALQVFLDYYRDHIVDQTRPFPGTRAALKKLQRAGAVMAVCTNKPQDLSEKVLAALKLNHFFKAIIGADAVENRKPHADHVLATLTAMGGTAEDAIFVGDSATDVDAARNAGLPIIAVTFGYSTIDPEDLGADDLIDNMADLSFAIDDLRA
jgi:phosphoglycolate phosphatase